MNKTEKDRLKIAKILKGYSIEEILYGKGDK